MHQLRKILFILLYGLFLANTSYADSVFQDNQGHLIDSKALKGKWIVVNYWAEWCGPCVREIPELNHFYKTNKKNDVVLFGVYYDKVSLDDLKRLANDANIKFPVLLDDPNQEWHLGEVAILPTTFIVNPKGEMVKAIYGGSTEITLLATIQELQKNYSEKK